jgi:hypothetical protein
LPSTACSSTQTCPLPIPSPYNWPRLLMSQTFNGISTLTIFPDYSSCSNKLCRWNRHSVLKRQHIKFRCRGLTQKKEYNIHNMTKVSNQRFLISFLLNLKATTDHHTYKCVYLLLSVIPTWQSCKPIRWKQC